MRNYRHKTVISSMRYIAHRGLLLLDVKVYNDGGHYIALIPTTGKSKLKSVRPVEEPIVVEDYAAPEDISDGAVCAADSCHNDEDKPDLVNDCKNSKESNAKTRRISTRSQEFKRWYVESIGMKWQPRRYYIADKLKGYFKCEEELFRFVDYKMQCAYRAARVRRTRCERRASLHKLNLFATFTYDSKKMNEEEFKKKLLNTLRHFASRKGWKYLGVWERGKATDRLHFHALMYIPEGSMSGVMERRREYDPQRKRMVEFEINTFFEKTFGRNRFDFIDGVALQYTTVAGYIVKYLEKYGGRIICSKGLKTFAEVQIDEEDILVPLYEYDDKKFVLRDDFRVFQNCKLLGIFSCEMLPKLKLTG